MTKIEASIMIERPVEQVWRFITDFSNISRWSPDIVEMRQTSPGPLGEGTSILVKHPNQTLSGRVTEYEPNRKFAFELTSGPPRGTSLGLTVEGVDGKTRFSQAFDFKLSGFYRLLGPLITGRSVRQGKAEAESNVSNVKRILESQAQVTSA